MKRILLFLVLFSALEARAQKNLDVKWTMSAGLGVPIREQRDMLQWWPAFTVSTLYHAGAFFIGVGMEFNNAFPHFKGDTLESIVRLHFANLMTGISIPAEWKYVSGPAIGFKFGLGTKNGNSLPVAPLDVGVFLQQNFNFADYTFGDGNIVPGMYLRETLQTNVYDTGPEMSFRNNYSGMIELGFKLMLVKK